VNRVEDRLCDHLVFGATFTSKAEAERRGYMPTLWEVCHDLEAYIKCGLLTEIPVNCSLKEIFEAEKLKSKVGTGNRILRQDFLDEDLIIHFKTVPGGTLYELLFTKSERSAHNGYFKKL
jgi:hypothetical protein